MIQGSWNARRAEFAEESSNYWDSPIEEPAYRWAAAFGVTSDGLPIIGAVPGLQNVYAAMGYGGNGITFSQIAAEIISSEILGHKDSDSSLFAFR